MKTSPHKMLATLLMFFSLAAVGQRAQAISPAPDGCYPNFTTAEGCNALVSLTTGAANTAIGWYPLFENSTGSFNTAVGAGALDLNTADSNTAVGVAALLLNTSGRESTAIGTAALEFNDSGNFNTANGAFALFSNTASDQNTAVGYQALFSTGTGLNTAVGYQALMANLGGLENTAMGDQALLGNTGGNFNVAVGGAALLTNTTGNDNTAVGGGALNDTTGSDNTAIGFQAGILATVGNGNVYVGAGMSGVASEANHTYVRNVNTTTVSGGNTDSVTVDLTTGLLGHLSSSRRYKENIKPMQEASKALFALNPVTFRYKKEIDQTQTLDYGLIAEEVAKVDPGLAIRDKDGQVESVRYSAINAMLLNEFLKEHKAFLEEQRKVQKLEAALDAVNQRLKQQEAKIEKVGAQIEMSKPAALAENP
jgi:trimeric autotransporter adhesin